MNLLLERLMNDPKERERINQRFQELSAKYPVTEVDRIIERAKEIQWWHSVKNIRITI